MGTGDLGKTYGDGEIIIRQGDVGDCMYVIQTGQVAVVREDGDQEVHLATLGEGDVFGEMALFDRETRSATVRAVGEARVLTLDKRTFLRRVHEDPSVAFRIVQSMSHRIRQLNDELVRLKGT
jgi:CRP/FNR family cyclic AMP-dependent transcriptional regulator